MKKLFLALYLSAALILIVMGIVILVSASPPLSIPIPSLLPISRLPSPTSVIFHSKSEYEMVSRVVDGDTIELADGRIIRYIGIDTPETKHPKKAIMCFGKEASEKNRQLVEGRFVKLQTDVSDKDRYGRFLRYVWIEDTFVNDYLVSEGYAQTATFPPDVRYADLFIKSQTKARELKKGLWSACQNVP